MRAICYKGLGELISLVLWTVWEWYFPLCYLLLWDIERLGVCSIPEGILIVVRGRLQTQGGTNVVGFRGPRQNHMI
jgi:hypothetical protein